MEGVGWQALVEELGGEPPRGLARLGDPELRALGDDLRLAKQRQQAQLKTALEGALNHIPALLRGAVRKILFA